MALHRRGVLAAAVAAAVSGCTSSEPEAPPATSALPTTMGMLSRTPAPTPSPTETLPPVTSQWSLPALMREELAGGDVRVLREALSTDSYRRWEISYPSGDLTITGVLLRPRGAGPFPGVVLAHGHIDESIYVTGQGLTRESQRLASEGYAVLHTDYRGLAGSDPGSTLSVESRLGYTRDTINAVLALKRLPYVDPGRVGLLGRSMGGGVLQNVLVAKPGLVGAAVAYASVSSDIVDNIERWAVPERPGLVADIYRRFGTPQESPDFYADLSARTYFDRITEPVLLHHGTSDDSCPIAWSRTTQRLMRAAGVDSRLRVYQGEEHAFGPQWELSIRRSVDFLDRHLA